MSTLYRTREGDMLDAICKAELGSEAEVVRVMEANPHLADLGPILPRGTVITIPDPLPSAAVTSRLRLWGRS